MCIHWGELQNLFMALQFYLMRHVKARQEEVLCHTHVFPSERDLKQSQLMPSKVHLGFNTNKYIKHNLSKI